MIESSKIKALFAWHAVGPYHVTRMRALASHPRIDLAVTRLRAESAERRWRFDADAIDAPFFEFADLPEALLAKLDVLVLAGWYEPGLRSLLGRVGGDCRRLTFSESCVHDRMRFGLKELFKKRRLSAIDGGLAAGKFAADYLRSLGMPAARVWEIGNIADPEPFERAARENLHDERHAGCILYAGRLAPEKNLAAMLHGYRRAQANGVNLPPLVLAGSGPEEPRLRRLAGEIGLHERVAFLGETEPEPLAGLMAGCGFLVLPSLREPWGLVVNEAMAASRPVLASPSCGCQPELLRPGASWLLGGFTARDIAEGFARAMADQPRWAAMGGKAAVLAEVLSPASYAERAAEAFDAVIRMPRRGDAKARNSPLDSRRAAPTHQTA